MSINHRNWLLASALCLAAASPAAAQTETVLYSFTGSTTDAYPVGTLLIDRSGNLYGSAEGIFKPHTEGYLRTGALDFELSPPAAPGGAWTQNVLYSFTSNKFGIPVGGLAADTKGDLYGIGAFGPASATDSCYSYKTHPVGCGLIYALKAPTHTVPDWTAKKTFSFQTTVEGSTADTGVLPTGGLIADSTGAFYGVTSQGGANYPSGGGYGGVVFKLSPPKGAVKTWTETVLYNFCGQTSCADGELPIGPLARDASGALYGATTGGGNTACSTQYAGCGVVYKLTPPTAPGGSWTYSTLYQFTGGTTDGAEPNGGVALDSAGAIYGTTTFAGASACTTFAANGCGVVYKLTPPTGGGAWTESVLYNFQGGSDGFYPAFSLVLDAAGAIYGTTQSGGNGAGTVFKLAPPATVGASWTEAWLYAFQTGGGDAQLPYGGVILGNDGSTIYGTGFDGGANDYGAVFQITQ